MKKYTLIYEKLKEQIINGEYVYGEKIPSVRKTAKTYGVSLNTVQSAFFELCADGYIISHEKSGYFVAYNFKQTKLNVDGEKEKKYLYDFLGGCADKESFDFTLWQRYIKSAIRQEERLLSYSTPKGEYDLRCAIASYIKQKRNVTASAHRIIIGAGIGPLLQILCSLLEKDKTVSFPDKSFVNGIGIFEDYGFNVSTRNKNADIIYVSPSHMTRWGAVMPIKRRLELVNHSREQGSIVIEDDFENEFLYNIKPTPSLYALGFGNVIYISSFSAMLLPGIRISFMVLTEELTEKFNANIHKYAQTASKTEQIALCSYIRDGHIKSQTAKIRRLYTAKTKEFALVLSKYLPNAKITISENTLQIILTHSFNKPISIFEENNINVFCEKYENNQITLIISPSALPQKELENAAKKLGEIITL